MKVLAVNKIKARVQYDIQTSTENFIVKVGDRNIVSHNSMLRPMDLEGKLRWGSMAGWSTDVSNFAEDFITKNQKYNDFALYCRDKGYTPIFEYVGPHNKVVLNYETENMILLAVRDTVSGQYLEIR